MPEDWRTGLFKIVQGDLLFFYNWKGIALFSLTSKVRSVRSRKSAGLLLRRRPLVKRSKEQATGFHKGRSCGDHIFILKQEVRADGVSRRELRREAKERQQGWSLISLPHAPKGTKRIDGRE